jgi:formylglycine-generating enzyme required for sulfatase activity
MIPKLTSILSLAFLAGCPASRPVKPQPTPGALPPAVVKILPGDGRDPTPMALIPAGPFLRGSPPGHGEEDERPQRVIALDAFAIDRYPVTVAQFRRCVAARACSAPESEKGCNYGGVPLAPAAPAAPAADEEAPAAPAAPASQPVPREDHPVNCVSWSQAQSYCAWVGKRLPTEAEWEKAARGSDGRFFPWGNLDPSCERANYALGEEKYCVAGGGTVAATAFEAAASPYGVVQMAGNVYNWVSDWHDREYYAVSPERNPTGAAVGKYRVVRGGSWFSRAADLRLTMRGLIPPQASFNYVGFRCARAVPAS